MLGSFRTWKAALWVGAGLFFTAYLALNFNTWWTYNCLTDFGLFMQAMDDPSGMLRNSVEGSHFYVHFSPIYDLFAPFIQLTHSVLPILILQSLAGALVGIGVYELAKDRLPKSYAVAAAWVAFLYPPLGGLIYNVPYETCFAPAATIWLFVFVLRRNWAAASLVAIFTLGIKEDQGIFLAWDAVIAGIYAYQKGDRDLLRFSAVVLCGSLAVPAAWLVWRYDVHANWVALNPIFSPVASAVTPPVTSMLRRIGFLAEVLIPLGLLPLNSGPWLLFAVTPLLEVLIPPDDSLRDVQAHYSGVWIGYIMVAFVMGAARMSAARRNTLPKIFAWCLFASASILIFASPLHWKATVHGRTAQDAALDSILGNDLPPKGTIGVSNGPFGHLWSSRRFELGMKNLPCYALVDPSLFPQTQIRMFSTISKREAREYSLVWVKDGVELYHRKSCDPGK